MKLKVYEVQRARMDGKDEYSTEFLYLDYADAVEKFKQLVEEEKKIDWIEEALTTESDEHYKPELREEVDYWCVSVHYGLDCMYSAVTITEREVF